MFSPKQLEQYEALCERTGFAVLDRSQIALAGNDRATLLHKFCTQDVLAKKPGEGGEAFILNVQGKIVGYVYFFVCEDMLVLDTAAGQADALIKHLDRYVIREDVKFEDLSPVRSDVLVAGNGSTALLAKLTGNAPPAAMYAHQNARIADVVVSVSRVPYLTGDSFFVGVSSGDLAAFCRTLTDAGAVPCDPQVVDSRRIESAMPLYGVDITAENLPQEVNRDSQAIHFKKGCYLGQETVARIDALGHVNKLLVQVKFAGGTPIEPGLELKLGEKTVGKVTCSCWSPKHRAPLALAYVRREQAVAGTELASSVGQVEVIVG